CRPHPEEIRAPREYQLGPAPAFPASRLRHASPGRRRRSARHSGAARPPVAFHHAEVHPRLHPPIDGGLRQGSSPRLTLIPSSPGRTLSPSRAFRAMNLSSYRASDRTGALALLTPLRPPSRHSERSEESLFASIPEKKTRQPKPPRLEKAQVQARS